MDQRGRKISTSRGAPMVNVTPLLASFSDLTHLSLVLRALLKHTSLTLDKILIKCLHSAKLHDLLLAFQKSQCDSYSIMSYDIDKRDENHE